MNTCLSTNPSKAVSTVLDTLHGLFQGIRSKRPDNFFANKRHQQISVTKASKAQNISMLIKEKTKQLQ